MNTKPILFSGQMIRALLEGRKTQTRRVVKPLRHPFGQMLSVDQVAAEIANETCAVRCPYGQPGDLLWVRETCCGKELSDDESLHYSADDATCYGLDGVFYFADSHFQPIANTTESADRWVDLYNYRGKKAAKVTAIHMPRWASRLTLHITDVRVQRLQEISEGDAIAEGVGRDSDGWFDYLMPSVRCRASARGSFETLWKSINSAASWNANPWVWALTFDVIKSNVDHVIAGATV